MKSELPKWLLPVVIAAGVLVLVGIVVMANRPTSQLSPDELDLAKKQSDIQRQQSEQYAKGTISPGQTGEAEARQQSGSSGK